MAILKFNGTEITPASHDMQVTIQDIVTSDSGRVMSGRMYKTVVARKRTIAVSWNNITRTEALGIIANLKSGSNPVYVSVTYDGDQELSGTQTKDFYYGDISAAFQQVWIGNKKRYSKLSFNLIER